MKYADEFRDKEIALGLANAIQSEADPQRPYRFMEFCGGHTHAISRYGLEDMLPKNVRMIHGPGCPVCVLPAGRIDMAIRLAERPEIIFCVYGDLMRVPGSQGASLLKAKAKGADIRMVYSTIDALRIAEENPQRQIVFFAIGFETTTPPTAVMIRLAEKKQLANFSVFCNHVLTPPAMQNILESPDIRNIGRVEIDGFVGPAHVSTIIGTAPYEFFAEEFGKPVVISGFEPLDMMQAILMLVRQVNENRHEVENQYSRAVKRDGNLRAKEEVSDIFELRDQFEWRGLGQVPYSGLKLKRAFAKYDAEARFDMKELRVADNPACECGAILRGVKKPVDCKLFGTVCTPETPIGSCMVSSEGACAAHWTYGRFRDHQQRRAS
ncbi:MULTISPECIES: hydrogenase formation protein HypD [Bradyrhizobium]|uniref:Hydrogenase maturation factor n=3 Tax=Bradyrhizobium TaxID=374 RepID=A0A410VIR0_9BRAD|nr:MULTISPECIES: hydrogenase formation protein HypD [Bradyrhizobium]MCG2628034.1 hydrogenase formation protein HypD [Bradyrhizobium zhengyangense]MCG2643153.1 hydrogenase formation protein HypD [Bradyrhizobium zhengyangense]MCG2670533.1 hydrogenase formation protein HypD [Bradyrhizobium zhengyangense]MDN4985732.1 hydrogenase formation protein HypD [Bradyrhizobium sp. WYCCWR 13022]MDT4736573.1 hydrogenase formation protein HypD [Bradyrhizobium sp. WYCCWR 12699]